MKRWAPEACPEAQKVLQGCANWTHKQVRRLRESRLYDAVLAAARLYHQHCAECHVQGGWGTDRAANLHASDVQKATPGELEWFLRNGNTLRGMPSWSGLPEPRRWQIVAYLKTLR